MGAGGIQNLSQPEACPVLTSPWPVNHCCSLALGTEGSCWLRFRSLREAWGREWFWGIQSTGPWGCRGRHCARSRVTSLGQPVGRVCVDQDVPVLWSSDGLLLATGFCWSVYF